MTDEAPPVRARGLVKRYDEVVAVDHVDLNVQERRRVRLSGPNGAGKTTTLRMALGLITPTEGTVELFGRDPLREGARALEGVAGFVEAPRFYPYLTAARTSNCSPRSMAMAPPSGSMRSSTSSSSRRARGTALAAIRTGCASAWGSPPRCCAARAC